MRKRLILLSLLLFTTKAWSALTIASVSGASNYILLAITGSQPTIFGGMAGLPCESVGGATCSSCLSTNTCAAGAPFCACNTTRITANTVLRIALANTTASTGLPAIVLAGSTTATSLQLNTPNNGGAFVDIPWDTICPYLVGAGATTGGTTCENMAAAAGTYTGTLTICIASALGAVTCDTNSSLQVLVKMVSPGTPTSNFDVYGSPNSEGIGGFSPYPGDEKIYIENINITQDASFPNMSYGTPITAVRMFHSTTAMDDANAIAGQASDLQVVDNGANLAPNAVTGLKNGQLYYFRMGMVDQANNLVQYFPGANPDPNCAPGHTPQTDCPYAKTPDQVLGLLTKDVNCFIATAAYGSSMEPKINTFRDFRYKVLLPHEWGKRLVIAYYHYGPYAARFIADKPVLRAAARGLLWPLYGFSWLSLRVGLPHASLLSLLIITSLLMLTLFGVRRIRSRA